MPATLPCRRDLPHLVPTPIRTKLSLSRFRSDATLRTDPLLQRGTEPRSHVGAVGIVERSDRQGNAMTAITARPPSASALVKEPTSLEDPGLDLQFLADLVLKAIY